MVVLAFVFGLNPSVAAALLPGAVSILRTVRSSGSSQSYTQCHLPMVVVLCGTCPCRLLVGYLRSFLERGAHTSAPTPSQVRCHTRKACRISQNSTHPFVDFVLVYIYTQHIDLHGNLLLLLVSTLLNSELRLLAVLICGIRSLKLQTSWVRWLRHSLVAPPSVTGYPVRCQVLCPAVPADDSAGTYQLLRNRLRTENTHWC